MPLKSQEKRKDKNVNRKKGKIQSGIAYDPMITKKKTLSFGRFMK
jgi:hypothetical protein